MDQKSFPTRRSTLIKAINWRFPDRDKSLPNNLPCAADGNSPPSQLIEALCHLRDLIGKSLRTQSLVVGDRGTETVHGLGDSTSSSELVRGDFEAVPHTGELVVPDTPEWFLGGIVELVWHKGFTNACVRAFMNIPHVFSERCSVERASSDPGERSLVSYCWMCDELPRDILDLGADSVDIDGRNQASLDHEFNVCTADEAGILDKFGKLVLLCFGKLPIVGSRIKVPGLDATGGTFVITVGTG